MKLFQKITTILTLIALMLVALPAQPVAAATLKVTNANDSGAGSLRQAISDANAGDTITFAGDTSITLASTMIINKNLTIDGAGHTIILSGNNTVRVMRITGDVSLNALTITHGFAENGGGILQESGTLTVTNSTFSENEAFTVGGGICNYGDLTVINSTLSKNQADDGGGGILNRGTLIVTNSNLSENQSTNGGGIYNNATLEVSHRQHLICQRSGLWRRHL